MIANAIFNLTDYINTTPPALSCHLSSALHFVIRPLVLFSHSLTGQKGPDIGEPKPEKLLHVKMTKPENWLDGNHKSC